MTEHRQIAPEVKEDDGGNDDLPEGYLSRPAPTGTGEARGGTEEVRRRSMGPGRGQTGSSRERGRGMGEGE